jgi:2-polyprenyl-3-methyl-5-hydroxy-6-metoxy-1,4-benzoquinol methylase
MILFVPATGKGYGVGHVIRSFRAVDAIGNRGSILLSEETYRSVRKIEKVAPELVMSFDQLDRIIDSNIEEGFIVLDQRRTSRSLLNMFPDGIPIVGIDEGGEDRKRFEYLIDILPMVAKVVPANYASIDLLGLVSVEKKAAVSPRRVLVAFGGEDPAGLSLPVARTVFSEVQKLYQDDSSRETLEREPGSPFIVVQMGPKAAAVDEAEGIEVRREPVRLKDEIHEYDLVCTSFGITAYEAAAAGVPVIIVSPTRYHDRLAKKAGFVRAGVGRVYGAQLRRALGDLDGVHRATLQAAPRQTISLGDFVSLLRFSGVNVCPVCRRPKNPSKARFHDRSFFECSECGLVYQITAKARPASYGTEYFFEEYAGQYGRTYLEDFEHIKAVSKQRLSNLIRLAAVDRVTSLLDVGCAFGPFLSVCEESRIPCFGIDVSEKAVGYVNDTLGLEAQCIPFEDFDSPDTFDALTMWFVLEHFGTVRGVLRKVNRLLKPGGIFAFSTPNFRGISGFSDPTRFLSESPSDHWTVWSPKVARLVMRRFGFRVVDMVSTGHHPERWPLIGKNGLITHGTGSDLMRWLSTVARLGDTFECYAVKEREIDEITEDR